KSNSSAKSSIVYGISSKKNKPPFLLLSPALVSKNTQNRTTLFPSGKRLMRFIFLLSVMLTLIFIHFISDNYPHFPCCKSRSIAACFAFISYILLFLLFYFILLRIFMFSVCSVFVYHNFSLFIFSVCICCVFHVNCIAH